MGGFHEAGVAAAPQQRWLTLRNTARSTIFDVDVPGGATLLDALEHGTRESSASARLAARDELGFTFGLTTCYDVRFPELYVALARRGTDACVSAFTL